MGRPAALCSELVSEHEQCVSPSRLQILPDEGRVCCASCQLAVLRWLGLFDEALITALCAASVFHWPSSGVYRESRHVFFSKHAHVTFNFQFLFLRRAFKEIPCLSAFHFCGTCAHASWTGQLLVQFSTVDVTLRRGAPTLFPHSCTTLRCTRGDPLLAGWLPAKLFLAACSGAPTKVAETRLFRSHSA